MKEIIYFNNSATSYPKPTQVIKTITEFLCAIPCQTDRGDFKSNSGDIIFETRKLIANFIHSPQHQNIIFTSGATEALNLAIFGIDYNQSHIITSSTEHNSVLRPLKTLEKENKIRLTIIPCDENGFVNPEDIESEIKSDTKVIIINHCSNVTGTVQDIKKISEIAHKNNCLFIVDASQSIGAIEIDVIENDIDILCFTGHKNLFGLQGIGGLYIKDGLRLKPLKVGGTGVRSDYLFQPENIPMYYEAGTPNVIGILSMKIGLDFILFTGIEKIANKKNKLYERLICGLEKFPEIILYGVNKKNTHLSVLAFNIKNVSPADVSYILQHSFNIITRSGLHCAPLIHQDIKSMPEGNVRVSLSYFNTFEEIDIFIATIKQIISELNK